MLAISKKPFKDAAKKYPNYAETITAAYKTLKQGDYRSPEELQKHFDSLTSCDQKDKWWIIDLAKKNLKLLAFIEFKAEKMFVKYIIPRDEYESLDDQYIKAEK